MDMPSESGNKIRSRSVKGCWACRLRRKKCDETQPVCVKCNTLGIDCDGYGPRPSYMDRGALQQAQARRIKSLVIRGNTKRKRDRADSRSEGEAVSVYTPGLSITDFSEPTQGSGSTEFGTTVTGCDMTSPLAMLHSHGAESSRDSFNEQWSNISSDIFADFEVVKDGTSLDLQLLPDLALTDLDVTAPPIPQEPTQTRLQFGSGQLSTHTWNPSIKDGIYLEHYLTKISPRHFPVQREGRGWLGAIVCGSPAVMRFSALVGRAHMRLNNETFQTASSYSYQEDARDITEILTTAVSPTAIMCMFDVQERLQQAIVGCTLLVQSIHLETSYGRTESCKDRLRQASPFIQIFIDARRIDQRSGIEHDHVTLRVKQLQAEGARVLLNQILWFDILAMVSCGCTSLLGIDHIEIFDSQIADIYDISGCENDIAKALVKIIELRRWKISLRAKNTPDVSTLLARGTNILEQLNNTMIWLDTSAELTAALETTISCTQVVPEHEAFSSRAREMSARLYGRAARIYLHSIISGYDPHLSVISQEVALIVELLCQYATETASSPPTWPLCVAACFASECQLAELQSRHHEFSNVAGESFAMRQKVYSLAGECHRLRAQGREWDWVETMRETDHDFLML